MMARKKTSSNKGKTYFDPRDFFPHMDALYSDNAVPSFPTDMEEFAREQVKAANPAYWMHMGQMMARSSVGAPWLWYGMMLGTMEAMRASGKKSEKVNKRHKEAVKAVRKFTKHVAGAKAVRPPKKKKNRKKDEISTPEVSNLLENVIPAPRDGKPDDLKLIAGVGPKLEGVLNGLGIYHFDQIAGWAQKEIDWIDDYLNFSGRIERDNWVGQAKALAVGGRDEYARVFGKEPR